MDKKSSTFHEDIDDIMETLYQSISNFAQIVIASVASDESLDNTEDKDVSEINKAVATELVKAFKPVSDTLKEKLHGTMVSIVTTNMEAILSGINKMKNKEEGTIKEDDNQVEKQH